MMKVPNPAAQGRPAPTGQFVDEASILPSAGPALEPTVRHQMECAFGADFSSVRVHQGHNAESLGARAFTQGNDIHFQPGQYNPHTTEGRNLLAHELTHVVQQNSITPAAPSPVPIPYPNIVNPS